MLNTIQEKATEKQQQSEWRCINSLTIPITVADGGEREYLPPFVPSTCLIESISSTTARGSTPNNHYPFVTSLTSPFVSLIRFLLLFISSYSISQPPLRPLPPENMSLHHVISPRRSK